MVSSVELIHSLARHNPQRFPFEFTSVSLRSHFDSTPISHRFHFGLTSNSLRSPIGFTSISRRSHFGSTSIPLRFHFGLIGLTSISLRFHIDFASISLRSHFEFTSVSHRFHFDFTSISLWPPLKPLQNTRKAKACGTTGTGGPAAQRQPTKSLNPSKNKRKLINTQQNSSRNNQGPPGIIHDLTEPLFIRFRKTKASTKPRPPRARTHARPRSTNHQTWMCKFQLKLGCSSFS